MTATIKHGTDPDVALADEPAADDELSVAQHKISHLEIALRSSRIIGMAIGIVIERCRLTPDEAFELLKNTSQHRHRKLRDVAADLVFTGVVPDVG